MNQPCRSACARVCCCCCCVFHQNAITPVLPCLCSALWGCCTPSHHPNTPGVAVRTCGHNVVNTGSGCGGTTYAAGCVADEATTAVGHQPSTRSCKVRLQWAVDGGSAMRAQVAWLFSRYQQPLHRPSYVCLSRLGCTRSFACSSCDYCFA